ncbi:7642_t:CDS:2 [Acaulospora morrowiae]|uniref:tRNA N(3)-methylcytidine methyltransferase n=1 Tax=Acaulospora morrowiae TaxID=94023 RepID=A0A9N9ANI8_9GLOM|nr:7642_t:CDS:2 [Acaulospora morrowiae]
MSESEENDQISQNEVTSSNTNAKPKKDWSSVCDVREGTPVFGTRILDNKDNVWNHNAWDNVQWDEEQEKSALEQVRRQAVKSMLPEEQEKYHQQAAEYWNDFYRHNENKFFKDRQWLKVEFPELVEATKLGCGAGNTMFPLLAENKNPELFIYACDFASNAVDVVMNNQDYDPSKCKAFVWDLTSDRIPECIEQGSLDIVVLIFVMSAIRPQDWNQVIENVYKMLKPGGLVLFRDYGRYDMVQLRFKEGRMISDNFYARGDEEIEALWGTRFTLEQNAVDRRLIVNRHRKLQMYRIWLQGKFRKRES